MDWYYKILLKLKVLKVLRDPGQTEAIFDMVDLACKIKDNEEMLLHFEKKLFEDPSFKEMWETRWMPPTLKMDELKKFPEGTLGEAYYQHLLSNNLDPELAPKTNLDRPIHYLNHRVIHAHDIVHTLLGLDTKVENEVAVLGFTFGQLNSPVVLTLIAGGFIHLIEKNPTNGKELYERTHSFIEKGQKAKFLLGFPLEEMLDRPIGEVRQELNII